MSGDEKKYRLKPDTLQAKFLLGLAFILFCFCVIAATLIYGLERRALENEAFHRTEVVMVAFEASRRYVREVLRPKMYEILPPDEFVLEAMSTSFVSRLIMERFHEVLPDFSYRRVAVNARNPDFEANELESGLINYFREHPEERNWQGIVQQEGKPYFMRFQPVRFEQSCLYCHGRPEDAPTAVVDLYGSRRGFHHDEPVAPLGLVSVGIPVDVGLRQIKATAWAVFSGAFLATFLLFGVIYFFFNQVVIRNLRGLLAIFRDVLQEEPRLPFRGRSLERDEVGGLTTAAETMAEYLRQSRRKQEEYARHLEESATELARSQELLQTVFNGITDLVVLLDRDCRIKMVNRAFLARYGVDFTRMDSQRCGELAGPLCPFAECAVLASGELGRAVTREVGLAGGEIFLVHFYPVLADDGVLQNIVCYGKEITEEKQREQRTQQTEKLAAIGQLAAGVAHEINNPLGVILCHAELLKNSLSERELADIKTIEKHALNCKRIVADLLNFARGREQIRTPTSLNQVLEEVLDLTAAQFRQQDITVETALAPDLPLLELDPDRIKQVFLNIMINAAQALAGPGKISVYSRQRGGWVEAEVADNGRGIPPHQRERIFEPFFTTKPPGQGTGLGLSVSYGIVRNHDGEIKVSSEPGRGTRVTVILPTSAGRRTAHHEKEENA